MPSWLNCRRVAVCFFGKKQTGGKYEVCFRHSLRAQAILAVCCKDKESPGFISGY